MGTSWYNIDHNLDHPSAIEESWWYITGTREPQIMWPSSAEEHSYILRQRQQGPIQGLRTFQKPLLLLYKPSVFYVMSQLEIWLQ